MRRWSSAEVVAGMIIADREGETFEAPDWFPRHYLSTRP